MWRVTMKMKKRGRKKRRRKKVKTRRKANDLGRQGQAASETVLNPIETECQELLLQFIGVSCIIILLLIVFLHILSFCRVHVSCQQKMEY